MKRFATLVAKFVVAISLVIGFTLIWCGLRVSTAISKGALEAQGSQCFNHLHLKQELEGSVPQQTVDHIISRQIWEYYEDQPNRKLSFLLVLSSSQIGWMTFWSRHERRAAYHVVADRLSICPSALKFLRERQELTPEIMFFATERHKSLSLSPPELD